MSFPLMPWVSPNIYPVPTATVSYVTIAQDTANQTTYTFTGVSLGSTTNRSGVAIFVSTLITLGGQVNSLTVGGVAATGYENPANQQLPTPIFVINNTSSSTADIVVTLSGTGGYCRVTVFGLYTATSIVPYVTGRFEGAGTTIVLNGAPQNAALAANRLSTNSNTTFTGVTENVDSVIESILATYGAAGSGAAATNDPVVTVNSAGTSAFTAAAWI